MDQIDTIVYYGKKLNLERIWLDPAERVEVIGVTGKDIVAYKLEATYRSDKPKDFDKVRVSEEEVTLTSYGRTATECFENFAKELNKNEFQK